MVKTQIMKRMASVRRATVPNGNCPEWQVSRMASVSNGNCPEWQLSQMATVRMASVSNGKCPKGKWRPAYFSTAASWLHASLIHHEREREREKLKIVVDDLPQVASFAVIIIVIIFITRQKFLLLENFP